MSAHGLGFTGRALAIAPLPLSSVWWVSLVVMPRKWLLYSDERYRATWQSCCDRGRNLGLWSLVHTNVGAAYLDRLVCSVIYGIGAALKPVCSLVLELTFQDWLFNGAYEN